MKYRHRITGIRWDDPKGERRVAYDPAPRHVLTEHQARDALINMKNTTQWSGYWHSLRIERLPVQIEWEPVER